MAIFNHNGLTFTTKTADTLTHESITPKRIGEISEYEISIELENEMSPSEYVIEFSVPQVDILGFWSPNALLQKNITPDWWMREQSSRTASGMPLVSLYNKQDESRFTVALSDPATPAKIQVGNIEETGHALIRISIFSALSPKMKRYTATLRLDMRQIKMVDAVREVRAWWSELGYTSAYVPREARLPMYSTWYSFHQHTTSKEILYECKIAKEYGMDTAIVDDGWQTDDNSRGYAYCGAWQVCRTKIPDMKEFVDSVHKLGMKFVLWFSVPFVGFESESFERFKGMYLSTRKNSRACVLDPRFKEVREFLVNIYKKFATEYGVDGFKLDFIDSFGLSDESSTDYGKMDCISVEQGVERLLSEVKSELLKINPEILIEFRQSYVGPIVGKYGNFFRVADCPCDALVNKEASIALRLTSDKIPVHSDMIMWNENDTVRNVVCQLLGTLFAVPQISVRFDKITAEHKRLLLAYLTFWREHSDAILNGRLDAHGIDAGFSYVTSQNDEECVGALYQSVVASVSELKTSYIMNATAIDEIFVELDCRCEATTVSEFGEKQDTVCLSSGIHKLSVPIGGYVKIVRK